MGHGVEKRLIVKVRDNYFLLTEREGHTGRISLELFLTRKTEGPNSPELVRVPYMALPKGRFRR